MDLSTWGTDPWGLGELPLFRSPKLRSEPTCVRVAGSATDRRWTVAISGSEKLGYPVWEDEGWWLAMVQEVASKRFDGLSTSMTFPVGNLSGRLGLRDDERTRLAALDSLGRVGSLVLSTRVTLPSGGSRNSVRPLVQGMCFYAYEHTAMVTVNSRSEDRWIGEFMQVAAKIDVRVHRALQSRQEFAGRLYVVVASRSHGEPLRERLTITHPELRGMLAAARDEMTGLLPALRALREERIVGDFETSGAGVELTLGPALNGAPSNPPRLSSSI